MNQIHIISLRIFTIWYADIAITENASSKEEKFLRVYKTKFSSCLQKKLVNDYEISDYIHYNLTKFKHNLVDFWVFDSLVRLRIKK